MKPIPFNNTYINLGERFYVRTRPEPVPAPAMLRFNAELAESLGLPAADLDSPVGAEIFSGNRIPEGAEPLAMAYAGHQFGGFVPQLGDGRALLLGEVKGENNQSYSIHLKGSGKTAFSRNGDGRAALGPVIREYIVSEAMAALGVPTTRALAAVTTGEDVARERLLPGGVITRVASSFVRVGTFEYFAAREDIDATRTLADYVISNNYPDLKDRQANDDVSIYLDLLQAVVDKQAELIARWMQLGFIHGVMNTDNMSVAGETIDYGPCAFMDSFAHEQVFSSIDRQGRYAYSNQPSIGLWNLTRLAETLLPLISDDPDRAVEQAKSVLQSFVGRYQQSWLQGMRNKCGLSTSTKVAVREDDDRALIDELLATMENNQADFTLTFYHLSQLGNEPSDQDDEIRALFANPAQFDQWAKKWRERLRAELPDEQLRQENMLAVNPLYIPRNHQIEAAIRAAEDYDDYSLFHELHEVLQNPYTRQPGKERFALPPEPHEIVRQIFCGT